MGAGVIYCYFFIPKASKSGLQVPPALCTRLTLNAVLSPCRGVAIFGGKCFFLQPSPRNDSCHGLFYLPWDAPGLAALQGHTAQDLASHSWWGGGLGEEYPDRIGLGRSFVLCPGVELPPPRFDLLTHGLHWAGWGGGCLSLSSRFSLSFNLLAFWDESLIAGTICTAWPARAGCAGNVG